MIDLVGQCVLVQLDAQAGPGRQFNVAGVESQRLLKEALAQGTEFLTHEVGNRSVELHAGGGGDRPQGIVRSDGRVVGLGHSGDQPCFEDAAGVAQIGLQNRGGSQILWSSFQEMSFPET